MSSFSFSPDICLLPLSLFIPRSLPYAATVTTSSFHCLYIECRQMFTE